MNIAITLKYLITLFLLLTIQVPYFVAQDKQKKTIGVVLSGGGAKAFVHLELLRVLEENQVPISYIGGASMGAFIAGLYAAGYTIDEIEQLITSKAFGLWSKGYLTEKESYRFSKEDLGVQSGLNILFTDKAVLKDFIPTKIYSNFPLQINTMERITRVNKQIQGNFDSTVIPFFAVGSEVRSKNSILLREGNLGEAMVISSSFPFVYPPIAKDSFIFIDGGTYNNFPIQVMQEEYQPDVIIGGLLDRRYSTQKKSKKNINPTANYLELMINVLRSKTKYDYNDSNIHIVIFDSLENIGLFDLEFAEDALKRGKENIKKYIPLLSQFKDSIAFQQFLENKKRFREKMDEYDFVYKPKGDKFIDRVFKKYYTSPTTFENLKSKIFQLYEDNRFDNIKYETKYNKASKHYELLAENYTFYNFDIAPHFFLSTNGINQGQINIRYSLMGSGIHTFYTKLKFGSIENLVTGGYGLDFTFLNNVLKFNAKVTAFQQDFSSFRINGFDVFLGNTDLDAIYLEDGVFGDVSLSVPFLRNGKMKFGLKYGVDQLHYIFPSPNQPLASLVAGLENKRRYQGMAQYMDLRYNTLDDIDFPNKGRRYFIHINNFNGDVLSVDYEANSIVPLRAEREKHILNIEAGFDQYASFNPNYSLGLVSRFHFINNPFDADNSFHANLLLIPKFDVLIEPAIFYQRSFSSTRALTVGLKNILTPFKKNIVLRSLKLYLEGYMFIRNIELFNDNQRAIINNLTFRKSVQFISSASLVFKTFLGPLALSANYYGSQIPASFFIRFGLFIPTKYKLIR